MQRRLFSIGLLSTATLALPGCADPSTDNVAKLRNLDADVDKALGRLQSQVVGSRELLGRARGTLVFPKVVSAGLVIAGSYGEGALRISGGPSQYYTTGSGSLGVTVGAQTKAVFVLFLTDDALQRFLESDGWTAGADAAVVVAKFGKDGLIDTTTARAPVVGFVLSTEGLMLDLSIEGTKVRKMRT